jgi:hypothetical protein
LGWGSLFQQKMYAVWVLDFIVAFGLGVAFQYLGSPQGLCAKPRKPAQTKNMGPAATRGIELVSGSRNGSGYCQACEAPCSPLLGTRWISRRRPIAAA